MRNVGLALCTVPITTVKVPALGLSLFMVEDEIDPRLFIKLKPGFLEY